MGISSIKYLNFFIVLAASLFFPFQNCSIQNSFEALHSSETQTSAASNPVNAPPPVSVPATPSVPIVSDYTCDIDTINANLWVQLKYQNKIQFDFRIGSGGAVKELRDENKNALLAPSFGSETTDRVIQTVLWDFKITRAGYAGDNRLNFNQAGTSNNILSPTYFVKKQKNANTCIIDVYSSAEDSWDQNLSPYMNAQYKLLTHYEVTEGKIKVRKILYLQSLSTTGTTGTSADGVQSQFPQIYLENWIPFNRPMFNAMAMALDANAAPSWWYNTQNYPNYPAFPFTSTYGYSLVFNTSQTSTANMLAVVFGAREAQCIGSRCGAATSIGVLTQLNSMIFDTGLAILPASIYSNTPIGAIIDQSFFIFPHKGLNKSAADTLSQLVPIVPSLKLYLTDKDIVSQDLSDLVSELKALEGKPKTRTDQLGTLISPVF